MQAATALLSAISGELPDADGALQEPVADQPPANKPKRKKKGRGVKVDEFFNAKSPVATALASAPGAGWNKSMVDVVKYGNIKMGADDGGARSRNSQPCAQQHVCGRRYSAAHLPAAAGSTLCLP